jgi:phytanoyl-CoA hydroxylase
MADCPLTDAQIEDYRRNGFVVVPGLLGQADLDVWDQRFEDIVLGKVEIDDRMLVMKDVMVAKGAIDPESPLERIQKLQDFELDPVLDGYCQHPAVLGCVERLIGEGVMTIHNMLINKPPNVDGRHPLHQDLLYFPFRPADRIVASWTAMTRVTKENGCLVVVPGSHRGELMEHENPDWDHLNGGYFGVKDLGERIDQRVHLEMEPGDTVFFHPIILHGSGRNRTDGFRRAISAHYANNNCEWTWNIEDSSSRMYRIVTGERAGSQWSGTRKVDHEGVDPIDYVPAESPLEDSVRTRRDRARAEAEGQ